MMESTGAYENGVWRKCKDKSNKGKFVGTGVKDEYGLKKNTTGDFHNQ